MYLYLPEMPSCYNVGDVEMTFLKKVIQENSIEIFFYTI